ncbi:MAG: pyridoxal 5'-phosphate synthase glutaminase subunit PdxT [Clostridium sp.]|uniref:pyridoxal 5'-phosphate synthase glutaminase subunit PdxT n=1 Tax=Clostridium sp. TaxID=1506 RepID=UPI00303DC07D
MITVGVLDLQGAVTEHVDKLNKIEWVIALRIKNVEDLNKVQGIILPGGESTAIGTLLRDFRIVDTLREKIKGGLPVWGTCAGMILLAKKIEGYDFNYIGTMNVEVKRNAYGAQVESFMVDEIVVGVSDIKIPMVFIRAPYVKRLLGDVEVLSEVNGNIVACRENNMLATSFHPELSQDLTMHRYFCKMCSEYV